MLTRHISCLLLLTIFNVAFISTSVASVFPQIEPCFAKKLAKSQPLPKSTPIIQVMGHNFRKGDECFPFYVTFTWENYYSKEDGYTEYSLEFTQTFSGELWYRTDREEFTLVGNPAHWGGLSKVKKFIGGGQVCIEYEADGKCLDLHEYDYGDVRAVKTPDAYLASLGYAYPAIKVGNQAIPVLFDAISPAFEFWDGQRKWTPNDGLIKVSNPDLISIDFPALIDAALNQGIYQTIVNYNGDNDPEDTIGHNKGSLSIKLDFTDCGGFNSSDMDHCDQIMGLIDDLEFALTLRDLYPEALKGIDKKPDCDIHLEVKKLLRQRIPYITEAELNTMFDQSGITNSVTLDYEVPDYCDECTAKPYCEWQRRFITRHEQAAVEFLEDHPAKHHKLKQTTAHTNSSQHCIDTETIVSETEVYAYNERAKYLRDLIFDELNNNQECEMNDYYESTFQTIIQDISYGGSN